MYKGVSQDGEGDKPNPFEDYMYGVSTDAERLRQQNSKKNLGKKNVSSVMKGLAKRVNSNSVIIEGDQIA